MDDQWINVGGPLRWCDVLAQDQLKGRFTEPGFDIQLADIDPFHRRRLVWPFCRPVHDQVAFHHGALVAFGMVQTGSEIEMALRGLALLIGGEAVVSELDILKLPAVAREVFDPLSPLAGRERGARPCRLAQLNAVRQGPRRSPLSQNDFTQRKAGDNTEFIGRAVDRIPERFKSPATALSKHLLAPNTFVRRFLPHFEPRVSPRWVAADTGRRVG